MAYKNNSKAKRYYWLQLKTDFFDQKEIKLLRKIAGGDTYTIVYLKMLLASLQDDGKLYFEAIGDNFAEEIALLIDEETENVSITIKFLEAKKLIEIIEDDEYFLNKVPSMIGSESYSAERMRNMREREKKKELQSDEDASQSDNKSSQCDKKQQSDGGASQSDSGVTKRREEKSREENSHSYSKKESDDNEFSDLRPIYAYYENNGFGSITPKTMTDFQYWIDDFVKTGVNETDAIELIIYALGKAIDNNVRKYSYVNSILKDYENKRYRSVDQIKADEQKIASNNSKYADTSNWKVAEEDF